MRARHCRSTDRTPACSRRRGLGKRLAARCSWVAILARFCWQTDSAPVGQGHRQGQEVPPPPCSRAVRQLRRSHLPRLFSYIYVYLLPHARLGHTGLYSGWAGATEPGSHGAGRTDAKSPVEGVLPPGLTADAKSSCRRFFAHAEDSVRCAEARDCLLETPGAGRTNARLARAAPQGKSSVDQAHPQDGACQPSTLRGVLASQFPGIKNSLYILYLSQKHYY